MTRQGRRVVAGLVLAAYAVFVVVLVLWPNGADINRLNVDLYVFFLYRGMPGRVTPEWYAAGLNVVLLAPLTFVGALAADRFGWWVWALGGVLASVAVEVAQATVMSARVASVGDILTNATGAVVGALLGFALRRRGARADDG